MRKPLDLHAHQIRQDVQAILNRYTEVLHALRNAQRALQTAFDEHDAALVHAIAANQSALELVTRLLDDGVEPEPKA